MDLARCIITRRNASPWYHLSISFSVIEPSFACSKNHLSLGRVSILSNWKSHSRHIPLLFDTISLVLMNRMIPPLALLCSLLTLFLSIWIIVRAPDRIFWLASIVVGEWSLFFGAVSLVGVCTGILSVRNEAMVSGYVSIVCGSIAFLICLYPLVTMLPVASANGAGLSVVRYFTGRPIPPKAQVDTHSYSEAEGEPLRLDVYSQEAPNKRPAIIVIHGGSWNGGTRSDFPAWNHWFVNEGYVVFDIDYRLTPQPNWETATQDVKDAIQWIRERSDRFGIDPNRVALVGRSAGGHLALQAGYTANDTLNEHVQAVIAFYAPADLKWGYENPAVLRVNDGSAQLRAFTGGTPESEPEVYRKASPISYVGRHTPPTLLIHGEKDQLVGTFHTVSLYRTLLGENRTPNRHRVLFIPYGQHGFDYNFNGWGSQVTQVVIRDYLNHHLSSSLK